MSGDSGPQGWRLLYAAPGGGDDIAARFASIADLIAARLGEAVSAVRHADPLAALAGEGSARTLAWASSHHAAPVIGAGRATPLVMAQYRGDPFYRAMIVGRGEAAGVDWPAGARDARVLFGRTETLAGWIAPAADLRRRGLDPMTFFRAERVDNPAEVIPRVMRGEADFGCTYDRALRAQCASGAIEASSFTIVWASDPLPYDTILAPSDLGGDVIGRLRNTLLAIARPDELERTPPGMTGFSYAAPADYEALSRLLDQS